MKKYLVGLAVVLAGSLSCRKDNTAPDKVKQNNVSDSLSLASVQNWFQQNATSKTLNAKTLSTNNNVNAHFNISKQSLDWSKAGNIHDSKRNWWIVSVPGTPTFQGVKQGYRKLAFTRDSTGNIKANILEIIPDAAYLFMRHKADTKTFTGHVFVYDLNYQLTGGMIYNNGKQVGQIKPKVSSLNSISVSGNRKLKMVVDKVAFTASCDWEDGNYIDSEGEAAIYTYQVCEYSIYDDGDGGGSGGGEPSGDPLGGGGGGGGSTDTAPAITVLPGSGNPGISPQAFMNCFGSLPDAGATETVTVYVLEPQPGLPFNVGQNSVGHTAISLTKTSNGQTVTQTVGFYPQNSMQAALGTSSKVVDNSQTPYTVSITYKVLPFEFNAIAAYIANPPSTYNLYTFNCTNFVYNACSAGNIILPNPNGNLGMFVTGMSPGALGGSIRNVAPDMNTNTSGGAMAQSHGPCN